MNQFKQLTEIRNITILTGATLSKRDCPGIHIYK
jgi:hypothetical protein